MAVSTAMNAPMKTGANRSWSMATLMMTPARVAQFDFHLSMNLGQLDTSG
jgi:hypothetical protein